jgi:hypothetical protein
MQSLTLAGAGGSRDCLPGKPLQLHGRMSLFTGKGRVHQ